MKVAFAHGAPVSEATGEEDRAVRDLSAQGRAEPPGDIPS
jgi:hypothetical protein